MAEAANVREWTDLVRRARLGRTTKGIAFLLATYADSDGSRVFPGIARVAVAAEVDYKTAKRALAELVNSGLLEKVKGHAGRRGRADEYRLCFDDELLWVADVKTPEVFTAMVDELRQRNRRKPKSTGNGVARTQGEDIDEDDEPDDGSTGNGTSANSGVQGTARPQYRERRSAVPNHEDLVTSTTLHSQSENLRTDVTVVGRPRDGPKIGNGFCLVCYAAGQFVIAVDEVNGSACRVHLAARVAA